MKPLSSSPLVFISLLLLLANIILYSEGSYHELKLPNVRGPESLAFDCNGEGPYTGVSDGRILKWKGTLMGWVEFAVTSPHRDRKLCDGSTDPSREHVCGRPLGLKFNSKTCNLYIADAYFGLLMVGPYGGVAKQVAISADDGVPFQFLNALDIDEQNGVVYLSDSSSVYQRREWPMIILTGDKTGRLLKYDTSSNKVQVLLQGLAFPNGVALSQDASFLLLAESSLKMIIHKVWLRGSRANTSELFVQLERGPDNIKRNKNGDFWVALSSNRVMLQNAVNAGMQNPTLIPWKMEEDLVGVKFDEKGETMEILDARGGQELDSVSEVDEHDGKLWIGSVVKDYVALVNDV